jgi:hypothetical protein
VAPVFLLFLASALLVAAAPAGGSATYDVTVDTIEGCSCPLFCTCYFGASSPGHMCQFNNVYKFRKGSHYGSVDLSDQLVWMSGDLGGEWHQNPGPGMPMNWVTVTFDKKSTPAQREAIQKVTGTVFNVKWKSMDTREDSISWEDNPQRSHAKMASGMAEIALDKQSTLRPDKNAPVAIKNLQYWFSNSNEGFILAYSTHNFNGTNKFSHEHKNGFTIAWTAKGEIKPEGGKAGQP